MREPDLTRLYFGDYAADTMEFTADQHILFQRALLQMWLQRPKRVTPGWVRKQTKLARADWHCIKPLFLGPLETARLGVERWNGAIKVYDGQRLPPFEWQLLRAVVFARDGYACRYCGAEEDLHADHRIAVSRGGSNGLENLVTACGACNQSKGSKLLADWRGAIR